MAIVQKTVKENGGTIGVESQVGRGTVFEVVLQMVRSGVRDICEKGNESEPGSGDR